jgi:hypothetical protein
MATRKSGRSTTPSSAVSRPDAEETPVHPSNVENSRRSAAVVQTTESSASPPSGRESSARRAPVPPAVSGDSPSDATRPAQRGQFAVPVAYEGSSGSIVAEQVAQLFAEIIASIVISDDDLPILNSIDMRFIFYLIRALQRRGMPDGAIGLVLNIGHKTVSNAANYVLTVDTQKPTLWQRLVTAMRRNGDSDTADAGIKLDHEFFTSVDKSIGREASAELLAELVRRGIVDKPKRGFAMYTWKGVASPELSVTELLRLHLFLHRDSTAQELSALMALPLQTIESTLEELRGVEGGNLSFRTAENGDVRWSVGSAFFGTTLPGSAAWAPHVIDLLSVVTEIIDAQMPGRQRPADPPFKSFFSTRHFDIWQARADLPQLKEAVDALRDAYDRVKELAKDKHPDERDHANVSRLMIMVGQLFKP